MTEEIQEIFETYRNWGENTETPKSIFHEVNFDDLEPGDFEDPYYGCESGLYIDNEFPSENHRYILIKA